MIKNPVATKIMASLTFPLYVAVLTFTLVPVPCLRPQTVYRRLAWPPAQAISRQTVAPNGASLGSIVQS